MIRRQSGDPIEHRGNGVTAGDTLEVAPGDVALFSRQGVLVRVLQAGTYTVPAEFAAPDMEVVFVTTRPIRHEKFGGPLGAGLPVRAAFGTFEWAIRDPERAVTAVGASDAAGLGRWVASTLQKAVQHAVAKAHLGGQPLAGLEPAMVAQANEKLGPQGVEVIAIGQLQPR